jgi:tetratricopeptide (TPR) repeat protein
MRLSFLLCFILFSAGLFAQVERNLNHSFDKNEEALFGEVLQQLDIKKYRKAIETLDKLSLSNKDNPNVYYFKGFSYNNLKKYNLAEGNIRIALSMDTTRYEFYRELGGAMFGMKRYEEAIGYLEQSKTLYSEDEHVFILLAMSKVKMRDYESAINEIEKLVVLNPQESFYKEYMEFVRSLIFEDK